MLVVGVVRRNSSRGLASSIIFVGASRVCSSRSTHDVFSPALVGGRLVLVGFGCFEGFTPVVSVLAQFFVN
jgi:hypothetical protein